MDETIHVGARMPAELVEALGFSAALNRRSVSGELRVALEEHLAREASRRRAEAMTDAELDAELTGVDRLAEGERRDGGPDVPGPASGAPSGGAAD